MQRRILHFEKPAMGDGKTMTKEGNAPLNFDQVHCSIGFEPHKHILLLIVRAQLHPPLVQVCGKPQDFGDVPLCNLQWLRCNLQWLRSATVPPATSLAIKGPAICIISDAFTIVIISTIEICTEPTQLRAVELAQDLDFMIKLASAPGQLRRAAGEPNVAMWWCFAWFQSSEPNQLGLRSRAGTCTQQSLGHRAVGIVCPRNV